MGVLGNLEIRRGLEDGNVVCRPLVPENIKGTSIDVTLGEWYFNTRRLPNTSGISWYEIDNFGWYNPFDQQSVKDMFGEPKRATPLKTSVPGIPDGHPVIWLEGRSRIIAHTHEFIGIRNGTSEMRARSSWGRNGIGVCLCAGWGDPGFIGRWAMEIQNFNDWPVVLPWGERVAQIILHAVQGLDSDYGQVQTSKYQSSSDLDEIVENWTPWSLLPKSYKDERTLPLPL